MASLDIKANRQAAKYTRHEQALRVLWGLVGWPLFRLSPAATVRLAAVCPAALRGAGGPPGAHLPSAEVYLPWNLTIGDWSAVGEGALLYNLGPVTIGSRVTVSQRAHLCAGTHDFRDPAMPLLKPPIVIADQVWVCADAFVGPGVTVGEARWWEPGRWW